MEKTARDCERITVALVPQAAADLARLQQGTGLSKTDVVNRGISLYYFIDGQARAGRDFIIRDRATGETQQVTFL